VHGAHCRYFADLMSRFGAELKQDEEPAALALLETERGNVREAWNWAISHRLIRELNLFMDCL
jgi:hypothetical protein